MQWSSQSMWCLCSSAQTPGNVGENLNRKAWTEKAGESFIPAHVPLFIFFFFLLCFLCVCVCEGGGFVSSCFCFVFNPFCSVAPLVALMSVSYARRSPAGDVLPPRIVLWEGAAASPEQRLLFHCGFKRSGSTWVETSVQGLYSACVFVREHS